jgi:hypothetical protein
MQRITNLLLDIATFILLVLIAISESILEFYDWIYGTDEAYDDMPERKEYKARSIFEDIN